MEEAGPLTTDARQELYSIFRSDQAFEEKAKAALDVGKAFLDIENAHLTRIDTATDHWEARVSTDDEDGTYPPGLELELGLTYCRRAITQDGATVLHNASEQGWEDDPAYQEHNLACYHGTPLHPDGDLYGTVCFVAADARDPFTDTELIMGELIAGMLERELERQQHEATLTRQSNLVNVLNRVLRHNLRNDLTVIRGRAEMAADRLDNGPNLDIALEKLEGLRALTERVRELDQIIAEETEREQRDLVAMIERAIARAHETYPQASVSMDTNEGDTAIHLLPSFERAITELIENAAKHGGGDPTITVLVELVPDGVQIQVRDTGPGLPQQEQRVLETGTESPLSHGSGLGLWLVHWIVTSHDGEVSVNVSDEGTIVTIEISRQPSTRAEAQVKKLRRARDQYQAAFEEAGDPMILLNDERQIIDANAKAGGVYGIAPYRVSGRSIDTFLPNSIDVEAAWDRFMVEGFQQAEVPILRENGTRQLVSYSAVSDVVPGVHLVIMRGVERSDSDALPLTQEV